MAKKSGSNSLSDALNMLKSVMPKDLKNASADELMGALGSLKSYVSNLSADMNENASDSVKEKYSGSMDALGNMIDKGMENPGGEIDTTGLDEYIGLAKKSKKISKQLEELESSAADASEEDK